MNLKTHPASFVRGLTRADGILSRGGTGDCLCIYSGLTMTRVRC
jgi:hypothetical protein